MPVPFPTVLLPLAADVPPDVSVDQVIADLADDHVAAPADEVPGLVDVVARAQKQGIDLSIVVLDKNPRMDSQLRDLATEVGAQEGGTVLVLSPNWVGTFSDSLSRVTLESAQDHTYTGDPVLSANNFLDGVSEPGPPWTLMTAVLCLGVAALAGILLVVKSRRRTEPATEEERRTSREN